MKHSGVPAIVLATVGMVAGAAVADEEARSCAPVSAAEIAGLFDNWNAALMTRDPDTVVDLYAQESVLLPTLSNQVRLTPAEKHDYFVHFLEDGPHGTIDQREIILGCDSAVDIGLYTFEFDDTGAVAHARYTFTYVWADGDWSISSHHSSLMPESGG